MAIIAGWVIGRWRLENHIEDWLREIRAAPAQVRETRLTWADRIGYGWDAVNEIIGRVWIYVVVAIFNMAM